MDGFQVILRCPREGYLDPVSNSSTDLLRGRSNSSRGVLIVANSLPLSLTASSRQACPRAVRSWLDKLTVNGLDGLTANTKRPCNRPAEVGALWALVLQYRYSYHQVKGARHENLHVPPDATP